MSIYDRAAATAERLLKRYGAPMALKRTVEGDYDPSTGSSSSVTQEHAATGVMLEYEQRDVDGSLIQQGDQRVYLSPDLAVTPETGDTLSLNGSLFTVVVSRALAPAGKVVLHDVQVRGVR